MTELKKKTAVVTGSSRGLGKITALALARSGANVVINYNSNQAEADEVVREITSEGGKAIAIGANVSLAEDVSRLFESAIAHFGKVDILVNNAGIMMTKPLQNFTEEEFDTQFAVNVKSVFLMMKAAAEKLEANGRIINVSSSTSRLMMPGYAVYSAAKAAVEQMTRVFAKEIGSRGITVNAVLPGPMNTELFLKGKSEELISRIAGLSAFNRIGETEDIVPLILFLSSDKSQWLTGQNIGINGGMA